MTPAFPMLTSRNLYGVSGVLGMKRLIAVVLVVMLSESALAGKQCGQDEEEDGTRLYLQRKFIDIETFRAKFCYAQDCRLIATALGDKEPLVEWYCK